ncbi:WXG100 family type VII secretion target [Nocardia inohanensis]|uniref:WXG100 family type VII secretion target n=1 Tax=Nocardia inohanensis TaxID=209246 RepID=UPI000A7582AC|nr:WXG100 family type VII secretion target [Nocardia inohanensis]
MGEAPSLSVQPDEVQALGRLAYDVATQCRDGYVALDDDVRDMLGRWIGNNAKAFGSGWAEFHEGAVQIWDALFELAASLGVTADTVRATDQSFAAGVSSLDLP